MPHKLFGQLFIPFILLLVLWWVLTRGEITSLTIGGPFIVLAIAAYKASGNSSQYTIRILYLPRFIGWFFWNSIKGGIEVSFRALSPKVIINQGFVQYKFDLPPGPARIFLVNCISLLPGTLSVDMEEDELVLHALDINANIISETRKAESQVKKLFNITIESKL